MDTSRECKYCKGLFKPKQKRSSICGKRDCRKKYQRDASRKWYANEENKKEKNSYSRQLYHLSKKNNIKTQPKD